jgi:hypothetical protein
VNSQGTANTPRRNRNPRSRRPPNDSLPTRHRAAGRRNTAARRLQSAWLSTGNALTSSSCSSIAGTAGWAFTCGEGGLHLAGGVESVSRAAFSREFRVFDSTLGARFPNPRIGAEFDRACASASGRGWR